MKLTGEEAELALKQINDCRERRQEKGSFCGECADFIHCANLRTKLGGEVLKMHLSASEDGLKILREKENK